MFWFVIYNSVFLPVLACLMFLSAIFIPKLREGFKGRLQTYKKLKLFLGKKHIRNDIYWFHAASLGEFYQIKPIIEGMKKMKKEMQLLQE